MTGLRSHVRLRSTAVFALVERHPRLALGGIALAVRLVFAVVSFVANDDVLIPDEKQYIELAGIVASGHSAESWFPSYGQSLYDGLRVFVVPIRVLFDVFGDSRLVAQLWPVLFGAVAAVLTFELARRVASRRLACVMGLLAALLPSQVLWSSVVLRESLVWAGTLAVILAGAEAARAGRRRTLVALVGIAAGIVWLAFLREQTMVVVVWAIAPAVWLAASRQRWLRSAGALIVAALVPLISGFGVLGVDIIERAVPALGGIRTNLAAGADSAFTGTTIPARRVSTTTTVADPEPDTTAPSAPTGATAGPDEIVLTTPTGEQVVVDKPGPGEPEQIALRAPSGLVVVVDKPDIKTGETAVVGVDGSVYVVGQENFGSTLSNVPRGVVATMLRPFAWEGADTLPLRFAAVENLLWYLLYALAAVGLVLGWRRARVVAGVPLVAAGLLFVAFVSQGNVGTAFRHRGQVLSLLAVLAAIGVEELRGRRRARSGDPDAVLADGADLEAISSNSPEPAIHARTS